MGFCYLPPERVKMGCCRLPAERVKLTVNSKKETNNRVKLGQKESSWAWVKFGLAHFDSESNWAKESRWVGTDIFRVAACLTK